MAVRTVEGVKRCCSGLFDCRLTLLATNRKLGGLYRGCRFYPSYQRSPRPGQACVLHVLR